MYLLFSLVLIGVLLNTAALILLKVGMQRIGHFNLSVDNVWPVALQVATSGPIIFGIVLYVLSLSNMLVVLSRMEVSVAYPLMSLGYIVTALAAYFVFGESLSSMKIAGILVIMVGVWMVSRTA